MPFLEVIFTKIMSKFFRQLSFSFIFAVYGLIFYLLFYYLTAFWKPEFFVIPARLSSEYIAGVTLIFTIIVILAYFGASYVLWGRLPSASKSASQKRLPKKRPQLQAEAVQSSTKDNTKAAKVTETAKPRAQAAQSSILAPRKPLLPKLNTKQQDAKQNGSNENAEQETEKGKK